MTFSLAVVTRCRARLLLRSDCGDAARFLLRVGPSYGLTGLGGPDPLAAHLNRLVHSRRLRGGVVEVDAGDGHWRIAALGLSAFVADDTFAQVLSGGHPGLFARFLSGPEQLLLDDRAQARAAADGLNLLVLGFVQDHDGPAGAQADVVIARAIEHFVTAHRGYAVKAMLREDPVSFLPVTQQTGLRILRMCLPVPGLPDMQFQGFLPEDLVDARPGSVMQMLFHFGPPTLGCSLTECRLLDLATAGLSDAAIATELGISRNTVKTLWRSINARGAAALYLDPHRPDPDRPVRGAEIRSHILLHLRDHPQDMRPWQHRAGREGAKDSPI